MDLNCKEVFYGGSAGPGKTDALLMGALMYVDTPGYAALILRQSYKRLGKPGSIMDRARQWLFNKPGVRWNGSEHNFRFPSGAVIQFGYIDNPEDRFQYQSDEYQYIAFEEMTEFKLQDDESNPYQFMFSRLRKTADIDVPLRMRAASNPGQRGHLWVKKHFTTAESLIALRAGLPKVFYMDSVEGKNAKAFVPALLRDNPAVNADEYEMTLQHLPPIMRARLLSGDWDVSEGSLIDPDWFRYYDMVGEHLRPLETDGTTIIGNRTYDCREHYRFATIDTAGTERQIADTKKGKASWSVMAVWDCVRVDNKPWLFLRHLWRGQVNYVGLKENVKRVYDEWKPSRTLVENAHFGPALVADMQRLMPCETVSAQVKTIGIDTGKSGKVERASVLVTMLAEGRVFLPLNESTWKPKYQDELLAWTGDPEETADQIDVSSHAARHVSSGGAGGRLVGMMPIMGGRVFN